MGGAVPWRRGGGNPLTALLGRAATRRLRRGCRAQAARGEIFVARFDAVRTRIKDSAHWLGRVNWDSIAAAAEPGALASLAVELGLDAGTCGARLLILTALSTRSTYERAWEVVLAAAGGEERARLLEIRGIEDMANGANALEFSVAGWFLRGMSLDELEAVLAEAAGPGEGYSVVSMSASPQEALRFARRGIRRKSIPHVVAVLDAARARGLGAQPALYALASDALMLRPPEERAHRAFKLRYAAERQAHFDLAWPPGSSLAIRAVATVGEPGPDDLRRLGRTGVRVVDIADLL